MLISILLHYALTTCKNQNALFDMHHVIVLNVEELFFVL